jgi:P27 family predicted phage terminase small subunit
MAACTTDLAPPTHLAGEGKRFWTEVIEEYGAGTLEAYETQLLRLACEALDRGTQARRAIRRHGLTYDSPQGSPVARPEVALEKSSRAAFAQLVRQLGLGNIDDEADELEADQSLAGRVRPYSVRRRRGQYEQNKAAHS